MPFVVFTRVANIGYPDAQIVVSGEGLLNEVTIEIVPSTLALLPDQQARVEVAVAELLAQGIVVTDDPIYRLESWEIGDHLHLRLSERSYFDSILLKRFADWGIRSQVLAVVGVTECPDGFLIEQRSPQVAALPGRWHPLPSGGVQPPHHPYETFLAEAHEELGLEASEIQQIQCLGVVFCALSGVYQLVVRSTTTLNHQTLAQRTCSGAWERSLLFCAPKDSSELALWLKTYHGQLTGGGKMALVLEGQRRWGPTWAEQHL